MSTVRAKYGKLVHSFEGREIKHHQRSSFSKPNDTILTMPADLLIPIWRKYAYPGDTLKMNIGALLRLTTQKAPFFTPVVCDLHLWSVPIRQVWPHWLNMQGQQDQPGDSTDYLVPVINSGQNGFEFGSIFDYFWCRPGVPNYKTTSLFMRAYTHTWNTRYRDENLQDPIDFPLDEQDNASYYRLLPRGKRKDYITSRLPWINKGEEVLVPFSDVPVVGNGKALGLYNGTDYAGLNFASGEGYMTSQKNAYGKNIGTNITAAIPTQGYKAVGVPTVAQLGANLSNSGLVASMSLEGTTMSELYLANAIQQALQIDAQGGTRYDEQILARWGVEPRNYKVSAYPEFLGGGTFDLNLQIVPQTSSTNSTSPQGSLSSFGFINGATNTIIKSFDEHCIVFAVASIRPGKYYYQYGNDRDSFKRSRFDFYEPSLANLPEQAIFAGEIFMQPDTVMSSDNVTPKNTSPAGYNERWVEDKMSLSHICGHMRSDSPLSLDLWHLGLDYDASYINLNGQNIEENLSDPLRRVLAIDPSDTTPPFYGMFTFKEEWIKSMPVYNNASFLQF